MATVLLYLDEFDTTTAEARVISVTQAEDGRQDVTLDQTCFYPRGGGQDWDMGTITGPDGVFTVEEVRLDEQGVVHHMGTFSQGAFSQDAAVKLAVDGVRRSENTRLHSAGHLLDLAVDRLQYPWTPGRGAHYPHMSFVEYTGEFDPEQAEEIRKAIEETVRKAVTEGGENEIRFMPVSEMHTVCRHVPETIPTNKPARVVIYDGDFGVPCGGTHVKDLKDIGQVSITKVKAKKGIIKVSYIVGGIST
jgi:Ser-tRNA(Ala) deacylase AlaX